MGRAALCFLALALWATACTATPPDRDAGDPSPTTVSSNTPPSWTSTPGPAASEDVAGIPIESPSHGVAAIIRWAYDRDTALNGRVMVIDAAGSGLPDPAEVMALVAADPHYAGHDIRQGKRTELEDQGLIEDLAFPDGFLIEFSNPEVSSAEVSADVTKWASGTGALGSRLTARLSHDGWIVTASGQGWVS